MDKNIQNNLSVHEHANIEKAASAKFKLIIKQKVYFSFPKRFKFKEKDIIFTWIVVVWTLQPLEASPLKISVNLAQEATLGHHQSF